MKNLQRLIRLSLFITILSIAAFPCSAKSLTIPVIEEKGQISPRTDKIVWIFEKFNGRLYRRQYNVTQNKWIGDWELVK